MNIIKYRVSDIIELKKPHPCGSKNFKILRVGGIMRVVCMGCERNMDVDRLKLEKATKKILWNEEDARHE